MIDYNQQAQAELDEVKGKRMGNRKTNNKVRVKMLALPVRVCCDNKGECKTPGLSECTKRSIVKHTVFVPCLFSYFIQRMR